MDVADLALQVPRICDVNDLIDNDRDEKIIMTYLSFFRDKVFHSPLNPHWINHLVSSN